ncbi:hypothetical protein Bbelb_364130 [Branchiostoma belcheri]|nr:hypothetical protein Bbelb_364130 [Branchiostoma belcheri]
MLAPAHGIRKTPISGLGPDRAAIEVRRGAPAGRARAECEVPPWRLKIEIRLVAPAGRVRAGPIHDDRPVAEKSYWNYVDDYNLEEIRRITTQKSLQSDLNNLDTWTAENMLL